MSRLRGQLPPDFEPFFHNSLRFYFEAAQALRLNMGIQMLKYAIIVITALGSLWLADGGRNGLRVWPFLVGAAIIGYLFYDPKFKAKKYKVSSDQLRQQAYGELVRFLNPAFRFTTSAPQMDGEFRATGLFPTKLDYINESGCIAGSAGGRLAAAVGMRAGVIHESKDSKGRVTRTQKDVFNGIFMAVEFPRKFEGWVCVQRDGFESKFGWLAKEVQKMQDGQVVHLENQEFERRFKVRASDPVAAHFVLSSTFMDRVLNLDSQLSGVEFTMSFRNSVLYLALPMPMGFQLSGTDAHDWLSAAQKDAETFSRLMDILNELELGENYLDAGKASA